jgi:hypothetical protein
MPPKRSPSPQTDGWAGERQERQRRAMSAECRNKKKEFLFAFKLMKGELK